MTMKLTVQALSIPATAKLNLWVEEQLAAVRDRLRIDAAKVRLTRKPGASPAYQVEAHLVTPGPDVFAEGRDHTLPAAFAKMLRQLRGKISSRTTRRAQRIKDQAHAGRKV
jgi:ribosome-associated translation inhibitor RaiA